MSSEDAENLRDALLEIIDALTCILKDRREYALQFMKKSITRFQRCYNEGYKLAGSSLRTRVKGRMIASYICSTVNSFPVSEKLWRFLYDYITLSGRSYFEDCPDEEATFLKMEEESTEELKNAVAQNSIQTCIDYFNVLERFETMRNLAHGIWMAPDGSIKIERDHEAAWKSWLQVNPWTIDRTGKSLLIDYWWGIPKEFRSFGNEIMNRLASAEIKSVEDLEQVRREVIDWKP